MKENKKTIPLRQAISDVESQRLAEQTALQQQENESIRVFNLALSEFENKLLPEIKRVAASVPPEVYSIFEEMAAKIGQREGIKFEKRTLWCCGGLKSDEFNRYKAGFEHPYERLDAIKRIQAINAKTDWKSVTVIYGGKKQQYPQSAYHDDFKISLGSNSSSLDVYCACGNPSYEGSSLTLAPQDNIKKLAGFLAESLVGRKYEYHDPPSSSASEYDYARLD